MRRFEAPTLEEAYSQAAKAFSCSITALEITIIQHPSKGIFGFRKKAAIISARPIEAQKKQTPLADPETPKSLQATPQQTSTPSSPKHNNHGATEALRQASHNRHKPRQKKIANESPEVSQPTPPAKTIESSPTPPPIQEKEIFQNFYQESCDIQTAAIEIQKGVEKLFKTSCYTIDSIRVEPYDEQTILVEIKGEDAALLIGKEGYRYKALSTLLHSWVHAKYGLKLRLEIAEFLKNQEIMIEEYLKTIIPDIERKGRGATKPLDGILVHIALLKLREHFSDKYVAIRSNKYGDRYIIINDFIHQ